MSCWAVGLEERRAKAEKWAAELEPSEEKFIKNAVSFATEVADFLKLPAERKAAFLKAAEPYGKLRFTQKRESYRDYYMKYAERLAGAGRWDDWAEWQHTAEVRAGWVKVAELWAALLQKQLLPEEQVRWQAEVETRLQKAKALWAKQSKRRYEQWQATLRARLSEQLAKESEPFKLSPQRLKAMSAALDEAAAAYDAVAVKWWASMQPDWECNCYFHRASYLRELEARGVTTYSENSRAVKAGEEAFEKKFKSLLTVDEIAGMELRKKAADKRVKELLTAMQEHGLAGLERTRQGTRTAWLLEVGAAAKLTDERKDVLKKVLEEEQQRSNAEWGKLYAEDNEKTVRRIVMNGDEDEMEKMEQGRMWYGSSKASDYAKKNAAAAYQVTLQKVLTQQEQQLLAEVQKVTRAVVRSALVSLVVSEMDMKLNLQPEQRQKMEVLCMKEAGALEKLPGGWLALGDWADSSNLLQMIYPLPEKEVAAFLDQKQMEKFKELRQSQQYQWSEIQELLEGLK